MRRLLFLLILAAVTAGGAYVLQNYEIVGLTDLRLKPRGAAVSDGTGRVAPPVERDGESIRIASFNIQVFGQSKLEKPRVMQVLAEVVRRFDVVAIQEVRSKAPDVLPRFVDLVNSGGRHYDYVIGERLGRTSSKEQYSFVFDTASIEIDHSAIYTLDDPDDLLHREPMVAAFRVRGPPPEEAFTFTLINIHTDPDEVDIELNALDDVYRAVVADGRGEDDVILLGDLNVDEEHLGELGQVAGIYWAISGVPTNTRGTKSYDNILFHRASTVEFTGRAGVFDLMSEFQLSTTEALEVSDHLPIWAEFSVTEGGLPGRLAARPEESQR